jgi:hypothetical protein
MALDAFSAPTHPLGASPYTVRGLLMQACLQYAKERVPGGTKAARGALDPAARAYFEQRFSALQWYDAFAPLVFHRAVSALLRTTLTEQAKAFGIFTCRQDTASGPHSMMLRLFKPRHIASFMPKVAGFFIRCYDGLTVKEISKNEVHVTLTGLPAHPGLFMLHLSMAYAAELLTLTGANEPSFAIIRSDGAPLLEAVASLQWR